MTTSILIVDDERGFRVLAEEGLTRKGYEVQTAASLARGRAALEKSTPDVVLLDRRLPDGDGLDLLRQLASSTGAPLVIVITAYGDVENAVEALRAGATDYLTKPIQLADLLVKVERALEARGLKERLAMAEQSAARPPATPGTSAAARGVQQAIESVSRSPLTPVLLVGPSGAGKQYAAELLHRLTHTQNGRPFVEVNCAALPAELIESELFGHERGAFTDARTKRRGLVELADSGTLFLDEVTELTERAQAKLLKFLDTMKFRRVGGERELEVSLRVVAATNRNTEELVEQGRFRADLYHRLGVFSIRVPPLAERPEDIPALAHAFVSFFANRVKQRVTGLTPAALEKLCRYDWPGNVRELRNVVERAVILSPTPEIDEGSVVLQGTKRAQDRNSFFDVQLEHGTPPTLDRVERAYVLRVLEHCAGTRTRAAETLGISYPTLLKRLRELGID